MDAGLIALITAISGFAIFLIAMIVSVAMSCRHNWKVLGTKPMPFNTRTFGFVSNHNGEIIMEQCEICKRKHCYVTNGISENWDVDFDFANRNYFGGKIKELS